jgi:hypothetical protein
MVCEVRPSNQTKIMQLHLKKRVNGFTHPHSRHLFYHIHRNPLLILPLSQLINIRLARLVSVAFPFALVSLMAPNVSADLFTAIAPDTLVVVGDQAPAPEVEAAKRLAERLMSAGGPKDNLVLASDINTDLEKAASHHLMVVGTEASNRILERLESHWVLNRDWYYANRAPYESYMPTTGYYAAGYSTFPKSDATVGYVEWDRNPYWHYATNLALDDSLQPKTPASGGTTEQLPYRQIVRITGNSSAGVALAVDAVLQRHLLTGVATKDNTLPGPMSLFSIDTAHAAWPEAAPAWIPTSDLHEGNVTLLFAGWHLADSMTYAGFQDASGQAALHIWRGKYLTEKLWDYSPHVVVDPAFPMSRSPLFEASITRRASANEFFVAELPSSEAAASARDALIATLNHNKVTQAPWTLDEIGGIAWSASRFGTHITAHGPWVVMESFDADHRSLALSSLSTGLANVKTP